MSEKGLSVASGPIAAAGRAMVHGMAGTLASTSAFFLKIPGMGVRTPVENIVAAASHQLPFNMSTSARQPPQVAQDGVAGKHPSTELPTAAAVLGPRLSLLGARAYPHGMSRSGLENGGAVSISGPAVEEAPPAPTPPVLHEPVPVPLSALAGATVGEAQRLAEEAGGPESVSISIADLSNSSIRESKSSPLAETSQAVTTRSSQDRNRQEATSNRRIENSLSEEYVYRTSVHASPSGAANQLNRQIGLAHDENSAASQELDLLHLDTEMWQSHRRTPHQQARRSEQLLAATVSPCCLSVVVAAIWLSSGCNTWASAPCHMQLLCPTVQSLSTMVHLLDSLTFGDRSSSLAVVNYKPFGKMAGATGWPGTQLAAPTRSGSSATFLHEGYQHARTDTLVMDTWEVIFVRREWNHHWRCPECYQEVAQLPSASYRSAYWCMLGL